MKSMMLVSENANPYKTGKARICTVCGKEGSMDGIMKHIEANHIAGISVPCGPCGKIFKSSASLKDHDYRNHRNQ